MQRPEVLLVLGLVFPFSLPRHHLEHHSISLLRPVLQQIPWDSPFLGWRQCPMWRPRLRIPACTRYQYSLSYNRHHTPRDSRDLLVRWKGRQHCSHSLFHVGMRCVVLPSPCHRKLPRFATRDCCNYSRWSRRRNRRCLRWRRGGRRLGNGCRGHTRSMTLDYRLWRWLWWLLQVHRLLRGCVMWFGRCLSRNDGWRGQSSSLLWGWVR